MSHSPIRIFVVSCALCFAFGASRVGAHEGHGHGAHEHGIGELDVAVEGSTVELELTSPAVNLVGFEHPPRDAGERAALDEAVKALRDGTALFALSGGAGCVSRDVDVDSPLLDGHHAESHAGHADEHDGDDDHDEDEHGHEEHADFSVSWKIDCAHPASLRELDAGAFFARFPKTEKLRLKAATTGGQTSADLTAKQPAFRF
jgi:hypothetical protein